ncbi:MAG TPA: S41 family peptidase [Bacillota bacterium]|nr:S41 family peptidase [Bacillota bacterium]HOH10226.1 S41 family peptidase [Bacillota bacterium]HOS50021.1 S41 family peptidase [Bacillota bacterium]HOY89029.1 S41 family peptidase [Bacillota bacterium]HPI01188.1 S41 family peptidase [Bacillota bacterium]
MGFSRRTDGKRTGLRILSVLVMLLVLASTVYVIAAAPSAEQRTAKYKDVVEAFETLFLVRQNYYKAVSTSELIKAYLAEGNVQAMLDKLPDPYDTFLPADRYSKFKEDTEGTFEGIGILFGLRDNKITIISPMEGTPAYRAGLLPGDIITAVDGVSVEGRTTDEVSGMIKGKKGTTVVLSIERGLDAKKMEFPIVRDTIVDQPVRSYMLDDRAKIAYIELRSFTSRRAAAQMEEAIRTLKSKGAKGIILDLRYNGGGLVDMAVDIGGLFVGRQVILYTQGRDGVKYPVNSTVSKLVDVPVICLVNEYSASAAEILAGALQDLKGATILGSPTFGKGLVQTYYPISNGAAVGITTQVYLTPAGKAITHETPIQPDIVLVVTDEELAALKAEAGSKKIEEMTAEELMRVDPATDPQLKAAMEKLVEMTGQK